MGDENRTAGQPNEVLRNRSKSLATLSATAGGGLAVGLVLASGATIPNTAKLVGLVATTALFASSLAFMIGAAAQPVERRTEHLRFLRGIWTPWEIRHDGATAADLTNRVAARIIKANRVGMIMTIISVPMIVTALTFSIVPNFRSVSVTVSIAAPYTDIPNCGSVTEPFKTSLTQAQLSDESKYLDLRIPAGACSSGLNALLANLPRSAVSIFRAVPQ